MTYILSRAVRDHSGGNRVPEKSNGVMERGQSPYTAYLTHNITFHPNPVCYIAAVHYISTLGAVHHLVVVEGKKSGYSNLQYITL